MTRTRTRTRHGQHTLPTTVIVVILLLFLQGFLSVEGWSNSNSSPSTSNSRQPMPPLLRPSQSTPPPATTTRREWIQNTIATSVASVTTAGSSILLINNPSAAIAATGSEEQTTATSTATTTTTATVSFSASWNAVDGLNSNDGQFVAFDATAYQAMKDDPTRTPFFEQAILERLGDRPEECVVVDLGTGPFALFAVIAAKLGAGKVYAIESNPEVAASARQFVQRSGLGQIEILEGFSTEITLPEKADFIVAEIVGSIASEEGAYATIVDAQRFLKEPEKPNNWIPCRIQTYAAPASYGLHNLFGPPDFDWSKLKDPVRFSCRDQGLQLLCDPQLVEDINFDKPNNIVKSSSSSSIKKNVKFIVDGDRLAKNQQALTEEFLRDKKSSRDFASEIARKTSTTFSGIAFWPRVFVSPSIVIESRQYKTGDHQRSHWQTVLPIVAARPIPNIKGGETIDVSWQCDLPTDVKKSPSYRIEGTVKYA